MQITTPGLLIASATGLLAVLIMLAVYDSSNSNFHVGEARVACSQASYNLGWAKAGRDLQEIVQAEQAKSDACSVQTLAISKREEVDGRFEKMRSELSRAISELMSPNSS